MASDLSQQVIPYCDLIFFSAQKRGEQLYQQMQKLRQKGPHTVVATLGKEGNVALDKDGIHISSVTPVEQPLDTMGVGDCYIGTFLACWSEHMPIEVCMKKSRRVCSRCTCISWCIQTGGNRNYV